MRTGLLLLALAAGVSGHSLAEGSSREIAWMSPATAKVATVTIHPANQSAKRVLIFLENLSAPAGRSIEPDAAIGTLNAKGDWVVTVDYHHDPAAQSPALNLDFLALRELAPTWVGAKGVHCFILPAGFRLATDVVYFEGEGHTFTMDVWLPPAAPGDSTVPVVLQFAHNNADRMDSHNFVRYRDTLIEGLATLGFAVAMADHPTPPPGVSTYQVPDVIYKGRAAVRTLRAQVAAGGLVPGKAGVIGFSRGGAVAALTALVGPEQVPDAVGAQASGDASVQAAFCASGRYDLMALIDAPNAEAGGALEEAWGDPHQHPDRWRAASPSTYVSKLSPPFYQTVGSDDQSFRVTQSHLLAKALAEVGVEDALVVLPKTGHALPTDPATVQAVEAFFQHHLAQNR